MKLKKVCVCGGGLTSHSTVYMYYNQYPIVQNFRQFLKLYVLLF